VEQNYGANYDKWDNGLVGHISVISKKGDETVVKDLSSNKWSYKVGLHGWDNEFFSEDSPYASASKWESEYLTTNRMLTWYKVCCLLQWYKIGSLFYQTDKVITFYVFVYVRPLSKLLLDQSLLLWICKAWEKGMLGWMVIILVAHGLVMMQVRKVVVINLVTTVENIVTKSVSPIVASPHRDGWLYTPFL